ncbi:MAG: rod shape-determining protein [Firmicutes bacterium]|nr:rod shape-determining protein [Bacillota bacterium]
MLSADVGLDLGTASVIIYVRGRGIVLQEPSVVAIDEERRQVLAIGQAARDMLGRTPGPIAAIRPLRNGVVAHYQVTELMLRYFLRKALGGWHLSRPRLVACVPSAVTDVERRAVAEACRQAGAREVHLISEPMAAAIGAGLDVEEPVGNMVVDVGGGTTDVAVISLGSEVVADSVRVAGDSMDEAVMRHLKRQHNLVIGERSAEDLKIELGTVDPEGAVDVPPREVRGRDAVTGLPRTQQVEAEEIRAALMEPAMSIVDAVRRVLERTPPELAADIYERGVVMTGGGALLRGLDRLLSQQTGLPVQLAEDPITCVARGTGKVLDLLQRNRRVATTPAQRVV